MGMINAEKIIKWLIRKLVTFYFRHYHFYTYSWGIDEHTDLHVISEESYFKKHRFGLREEVLEDGNDD